VSVHPRYFRPTEVDLLLGNPAKAKRELGWAPKRNIDDIIAEMIVNDMAMMKNGRVERRESQAGL
jgi:GDPmannose 4,6-dehydratase